MKIILLILFIIFTACSDKPKVDHDHSVSTSHEMPTIISDAKVFFISPQNGEKISSPFQIKFGVDHLEVTPAGQGLGDGRKGHHHLIINGKFIPYGKIVPKDESHIHFGKGQTETELNLSPGKYNLTLQFADALHRSYGKSLSHTISITID